MPVPPGVPVSSDMKAARSEPTGRRPSSLPDGERGKPTQQRRQHRWRHLMVRKGALAPALPSTPSPSTLEDRAPHLSPFGLTGSAPLLRGKRTFG